MSPRALRIGFALSANLLMSSVGSAPAEPPPTPIAPLPGWPRWLESADGRQAAQTSGLAFVGRDGRGQPVFLAVDDDGTLWRITASEADSAFILDEIRFDQPADDTLSRFSKRDFESVSYCPASMRVLISIEGRDPDDGDRNGHATFRDAIGIYVAILDQPDPREASRVLRLERLLLPQWEAAIRLASPNRAIEGIAVREDTLVLGLEGVLVGEEGFADSTVIELFDLGERSRREFSTKPFGIVTITGLDVGPEGRWYGIDRNQQTLFSFRLGANGIVDYRATELSYPGVRGIPYTIPSAEGIALDDSGGIWITIDPWVYEPVTKKGLTKHDIANYKAKVPMIYKFADPFVVHASN